MSPSIGRLSRRSVLIGAGALAGCARMPVVVLDRSAMTGVKKLVLPVVGAPKDPTIVVFNTAIRGGLIGAIIINNRIRSLKAIMASQSFDPAAYFEAVLAQRLQASNFAVVPGPGIPDRQKFLASYDGEIGGDAVLDIYIKLYGFVALDDRDSEPFRPSVALDARLVSTRDKSVLMQDAVVVNGLEAPDRPLGVLGGTGFGLGSFTDFTAIEANPARAVVALRGAMTAAADGVVRRLA